MDVEIPFAKLQEDIHTALKSWHNTGSDESSLAYLHLFQQARPSGLDNARRLTNEILLTALDRLALEHKGGADLLRQRFLDGTLVQTIANRLNLGEATIYRRQSEALQHLTLVIQASERQTRAAYQVRLESHLKLPPPGQLFGIETRLSRLLEQLLAARAPWLISVEGLGGNGKSALANAVVRRSELVGRFAGLAWVSAKQRNFMPGVGLATETAPALTLEDLTDALLEQLGQTELLSHPPSEKRTALIKYLPRARPSATFTPTSTGKPGTC
jgi:hypothetical protein